MNFGENRKTFLKVTGDKVIGLRKKMGALRCKPHYGPGVDSAPNRNE
jgi:hypothetical protein